MHICVRNLHVSCGVGGEHLRVVWVQVNHQFLQTLTLFKTKSVHFATLFKTVAQMPCLWRYFLYR